MTKTWSEDMGEISGFGGGYEAVCRKMVLAGIAWIDAHPDANPKVKESPQIFGVVKIEGDEAEKLENVIVAASNNDCTGAMVHAAMQHVFAYKRLGWDEYCKQLRDRTKNATKKTGKKTK